MEVRRLVLVAGVFAGLLCTADANAFRGKLRQASMGSMSAEELRAKVLEEVMGALGNGNRVTEERLKGIESLVRPIFGAMPKNIHGNLDDAGSRYVLHRLFVQRHAMFVKGLEPGGADWNTEMSTSQILEDHIPSFVLSVFEERMKDRGLGMHEVAVLAATLEHLIHDEAVGRLEVVYEAHNMSTESTIDELQLQNLIDSYMTIFVMGQQNFSASTVVEQRQSIMEAYPGWHDTQKFTQQVRSGVIASKAGEEGFGTQQSLTFRAATAVVEEIGERYGRWQDSECQDLKETLMKMAHGKSGRVLLKDFYQSALDGNWQFSESVDYLRELGALDESDPHTLSVVIPNYLNSHSNCLASSSIYSVCCINECESLMAHLERNIEAHEAPANRILELVGSLPSATVAAPRELSKELRDRLEDVANHHAGMVPLHGRLFAQWLHHAFPHECPYPHASGKTNPMTPSEWMEAKGQDTTATADVMQSIIDLHSSGSHSSAKKSLTLPWSQEEELVTKHAMPQSKGSSVGRTLAMGVATVSAFVALFNTACGYMDALRGGKDSLLPMGKIHTC
eukprot:TRINITY_DN1133_c0_g1_i1.p1 TRINITY_DN1133_c0_g1~~TRINITY_DN1133_c0_g1_i1.p1  ORF type:complete len:565 (-),score=125.91 TRINITY_DN1133_c0_g1_i1:5-1699(-)